MFFETKLASLCGSHLRSSLMICCYCCTRSRELQVPLGGQANQVLEDRRSESTYVFK